MAIPAVLAVAGSVGFVAAEVTPPAGQTGVTTTQIVVGAVATVLVAVIGAGVQLYINKRRSSGKSGELTLDARMAVMETNQAEMKRTLNDIENHLRPWGDGKRR